MLKAFKMKYQLSKEQIQQWQKHRFLHIHDFFSGNEIKDMQHYADELMSWPETPGKWMKYFETTPAGDKQLCRVENFLDYHPALDLIARGNKTIDLLSDLMAEPAVIFKEKMNVKLPGGNGFTPHQDAPAFISFNQRYHITMMVAIDDSTIENGCLRLLHNDTHAGITLPQEKDGSIKKDICQNFDWQLAECKAGDLLFFDSYLPHYSEANLSNRSRRALYITYNKAAEGGSKRDEYFADKRLKFPPDCEREPGKDYGKGAEIYNVANPIATTHE